MPTKGERGEKFAVNEERVLTLLCPVHSSGSGEHPAFFRYTIARAAAFLFPVVDRPSPRLTRLLSAAFYSGF